MVDTCVLAGLIVVAVVDLSAVAVGFVVVAVPASVVVGPDAVGETRRCGQTDDAVRLQVVLRLDRLHRRRRLGSELSFRRDAAAWAMSAARIVFTPAPLSPNRTLSRGLVTTCAAPVEAVDVTEPPVGPVRRVAETSGVDPGPGRGVVVEPAGVARNVVVVTATGRRRKGVVVLLEVEDLLAPMQPATAGTNNAEAPLTAGVFKICREYRLNS